jgi:hypothetical protein
MADDQESSNDVGEGGDAPEISDYEETASASTSAVVFESTTTLPSDDYDDEPIEDYVVKLVVNEQPDGAIIDAAVTDIYGNTKFSDSFNDFTTAVYDELNGNGTAITGGKRWWGWSTKKLIFAGLVALCILGIILAIVFLILGKKFKNNKKSTSTGTTTTTKSVVTKGVSPDQKYQPVPNV